MADFFQYEYLRYAFACGAIIGILCAIVGVYVILRGMSFLSVGISHSALGGTAIGVASGINIEAASFAYCMLVVWLIGLLSSENKIKVDAAIGILFAISQALGLFIFSFSPSFRTDLNSLLFGSIITVGLQELIISAAVLLISIFVLSAYYRSLNSMIFDAEYAKVCGIKVHVLHYLLLTLTALAIVSSMQIVGILLVSALIVIPPSAAKLLCKDMKSLLVSSSVFGVFSAISGLIISFYTDTAPGPIIVMMSGLLFFACYLYSKFHRI